MKNFLVVAFLSISLTGCFESFDPPPPPSPPVNPEEVEMVDNCLRVKLFNTALKNMPAGPQITKYNDWDEVIDQIDRATYYQSLRQAKYIKPECRHQGL